VNRTVFSSYEKTVNEIRDRTECTVIQFPDTQFSICVCVCVCVCVSLHDVNSRAYVASVVDEWPWGTGGIFDTVEILGEKTCPTACLPPPPQIDWD
jgi:hypothetical protein